MLIDATLKENCPPTSLPKRNTWSAPRSSGQELGLQKLKPERPGWLFARPAAVLVDLFDDQLSYSGLPVFIACLEKNWTALIQPRSLLLAHTSERLGDALHHVLRRAIDIADRLSQLFARHRIDRQPRLFCFGDEF